MEQEVVTSTFANRDDPPSLLRIATGIPVSTTAGTEDSNVDHQSSDENHMLGDASTDKTSDAKPRRGLRGALHKRTQSLQDKLMETLLKQIIPPEELDGSYSVSSSKFERNVATKPGFSLPLMANNFRSFNARVGVVFVFQAQMIRLFSWDTTTHTLSFLATYSFVCLHPHLLIVLPLALLLFFVFLPAYLARHPPPSSPSLHSPRHIFSGPPIAPPRVIKPASELSPDFFRNMRDLQNVMGDFSKAHDVILDAFTPWTNFSNEPLSSGLFILLSFLICGLYLLAPFLPLRHIFLFGGWAAISLCHPSLQLRAEQTYSKHIKPLGLQALDKLDSWITQDITLDTTPEKVSVEIFELQCRHGGTIQSLAAPTSPSSSHHSFDQALAGEWEPWLFTPTPWEPLSPSRVSGQRPKGTRFFEDVQPPSGWEWAGKKWMLDLDSQEWVQGRMVSGCEVEVDGERWVYDYDSRSDGQGNGSGGSIGRGEWRRRRWIRTVQRERVSGGSSSTSSSKPLSMVLKGQK